MEEEEEAEEGRVPGVWVEGVCSDDDSDEEEDENDNSNNNNNTIPPVLALRPGPGPRLDALALEGL